MNEYILPDDGYWQKQDRRVQGRSKYEISLYGIAIKIRCVVARLAGGPSKLSRTGSAEVCWAARPARRIFHERALSLAPRSDKAHLPQAVAAAPAADPRTTQCWAPGHPCSADIALVFGGRLHDWPPPRGQVSTRGGGRQGRCRSAGGTGSGSVNYNLRRPAVAAARSATSRRSPCARPCWRPLV